MINHSLLFLSSIGLITQTTGLFAIYHDIWMAPKQCKWLTYFYFCRRECVQEFDPQQGFTVRTTREYEPGEQLCINYGRHNNLRLLRNYGFTLPSNPLDIISIPLPTDLQDLKPNDPALNQKVELLRALQLDTKRSLRSLEVTQGGDLTPQSRQWLQLSLASSEDLQSLFEQASMTSSTKTVAHAETLQLPAGLKKRVDDHIRAICTKRLSQHTSTLEVRTLFMYPCTT